MTHELDIKSLRESIKWKQDRLARFLGVDRSSVSHMENGRPVSGPVKRLLETLAAAAKAGTADALCPEETENAA
ncbi:helix-turn-helix transcriptional regulator [Rhizobium oryzihabitans]|uniref:Helix-turn-helix transcriptional regulator n=1 Tax=Rhizobium oryzihabitans TaxID=2267833 RepID=A0A7L5BD93_9HYPH|nr:helix-turn-helix transcriptional regulator [Rhizobium oryzihabitans]QIB36850.1 helix-turn-helix transcriptional regulator [Rhizobium oryzihabitans]